MIPKNGDNNLALDRRTNGPEICGAQTWMFGFTPQKSAVRLWV